MIRYLRYACFLLMAGVIVTMSWLVPVGFANAQDAEPETIDLSGLDTSEEAGPEAAPSAADVLAEAPPAEEQPEQTVNINWLEKMVQGGLTMLALALLSVAGAALLIERLLATRASRIAPSGLVAAIASKDVDAIAKQAKSSPSLLSKIATYVLDNRGEPNASVSETAGDIGGREIDDLVTRTTPLAAVAALAPLLGLLGTMIGMIESFELVSVYGDEGGASMLAGSIAKALITTAVGLIIAIPAVVAYHFVKYRIHVLGKQVEESVEALLGAVYKQPAQKDEPKPAPAVEQQQAQPAQGGGQTSE